MGKEQLINSSGGVLYCPVFETSVRLSMVRKDLSLIKCVSKAGAKVALIALE